jgi:hypothetical protein
VRRIGSMMVGPQDGADGKLPQFTLAGLEGYLSSDGLGELEQDQADLSILNLGGLGNDPDSVRYQLFRVLLEHPSLENQPRGEFMFMSAGADGIFMSKFDGPGSHEAPITDGDVESRVIEKGAAVLKDFDDVQAYGGG